MSLAVILLNWRNERQTLRCARAVAAWQDLRPHLYVVDNESTEATSETMASALASDSLICSPRNLGYAGGNNLGIRRALAAQHQYILLLNSDAEISEAGTIRLLERLQANPQISILGPLIHETRDGRTHLLVGGRDIARYASTRMAIAPPDLKRLPGYPLHEVDYVSGTVFLARASAFAETGLLDEEYFFSGEIADFCKRVKDRGCQIHVDLEVEARHDPGQAPPDIRETLHVYYGLRNRFLYVTRHHAREKMRYFAYWTMLGTLRLVRALSQGKTGRARAIILALTHAYTGRHGNQNAKFL
jgi:GT2 family glycosyltransferase